MHIPLSQVRLAVVGLGYVGLPLAIAFAQKKQFPVVGFDINADKISALQNGIDPTLEVGDSVIKVTDIAFTASPDVLKQCNVIIVAVPTPITPDRKPDLRMVESVVS